MKIKFKKMTETAHTPTKGSTGAAGWDIYADQAQDIRSRYAVWPGSTTMIDSGIAVEIPEGYFGALFSRSGLASKKGLRVATGVSVIDSDYRGSIGVPIHNDSNTTQFINPGERIAQLVIIPHSAVKLVEAQELSKTKRGTGGFGSTGQ